jgi:hypothetical protein
MNAEFVNMKEIEKNIDGVVKVASKTVEQGLMEVGQRGADIVKRNSPFISGRLRNSMSYTINNKVWSPYGGGGDDIIRKNSKKDEVVIGTNVIYAPYVEYMAKNGSAGFMLGSYKQLKPIAKKVMETVFKGAFK